MAVSSTKISSKKYSWPEASYVHTRPARRMWELINTVREQNCMGLVCGRPGVGKTVTARRYADWKRWEVDYQGVLPSTWLSREGVIYMAAHAATRASTFIRELGEAAGVRFEQQWRWTQISKAWRDLKARFIDTIMVDEADRLSDECLEIARDLHDRTGISVVLLGMPPLERRIEKFPQLHSRIGFYYEYPALCASETVEFLGLAQQDWPGFEGEPGVRWSLPEFSGSELAAIRVVHQLANGVPREIYRLMEQVDRLIRINEQEQMNVEIVRAAAQALFRHRHVPMRQKLESRRSSPSRSR